MSNNYPFEGRKLSMLNLPTEAKIFGLLSLISPFIISCSTANNLPPHTPRVTPSPSETPFKPEDKKQPTKEKTSIVFFNQNGQLVAEVKPQGCDGRPGCDDRREDPKFTDVAENVTNNTAQEKKNNTTPSDPETNGKSVVAHKKEKGEAGTPDRVLPRRKPALKQEVA